MGPGFPRPAVCVSRTGVATLIWVAWLLELVESLTRIVMAGKGFTVKKDWDNPREHTMPAEARVPAEVRLGRVFVAPATVLAPMAGVTDTVFRRFIRHASLFSASAVEVSQVSESRSFDRLRTGSGAPGDGNVDAVVTNAQSGCGLLMTEFTSADGLARMREIKRRRYLTFYDDEHPI